MLEDLGNQELDEYKKLLDSDLFSLEELDLYANKVNENGVSGRVVAEITKHSTQTILNWRAKGVLKAKRVKRTWYFKANEIIKAKKIFGIGAKGIIWQ